MIYFIITNAKMIYSTATILYEGYKVVSGIGSLAIKIYDLYEGNEVVLKDENINKNKKEDIVENKEKEILDDFVIVNKEKDKTE